MSNKNQVFQTKTKARWLTFQWSTRFILFLAALMIPIIAITLYRGFKPSLPTLLSQQTNNKFLSNPSVPIDLDRKEIKKYKGFNDFLKSKQKNEDLKNTQDKIITNQVRAAFLVDWDPQSLFSLQKNIDKLNMVVPEWFFINPKTDLIQLDIDPIALKLMKKHHVKIVPLINNIDVSKENGDFDGTMLHRILNNPIKRERLINDILKYLKLYDLQGINIDFEELKENSDEPLSNFQKELYAKLHPLGYIVSQDIMTGNEDFNIKELAKNNDYIFLMAYDEHYGGSVPGDISSQKWIESVLDETAKEMPSNKIIVCFAGYGYDWQKNSEGVTVTYQEALSTAKIHKSIIDFDNVSYNNKYNYTDDNGNSHTVYFADASTNFNTIRFADEYGTAGTALWRLGSEDDRLWRFYDRSLSNKSIQEKPFDFKTLENVNFRFQTPDYIGEGEVLNIISDPKPGKIKIEFDPKENSITNQDYLEMPTKYVIKKYGTVKKQVLLTFDDGPDPNYTPQILDILKKEKVPATFFIVGLQAENNLPLFERIYNEGHEIGNHTFTHPNIATVSIDRALAEIESTRLLIESVTGRSTVLFRAPYNADAEPTTESELKPIAISKKENYYTVGESIDPNDWQKETIADSIVKRTIEQYNANPDKGIILLHDAGGNREETVKALPRIIKYFKDRNIKFITLAQLLGKSKNELMPKVNNRLIIFDFLIFDFGYWFMHFITAVFWVAIFLGFFRILVITTMVFIKKQKDSKILSNCSTTINQTFPAVSIIVPAYNEELNASKTIYNLLQQDYPNFEITFVDDGSKDTTYTKILDLFANHPKVKIYTKLNGGKASALNFGIEKTTTNFVICIDADTQLKSDAISQLMKKFTDDIGAVAGNVKVGNENTMLTKWQSIEYITAQNFDRRAFDLINGITVVPGAIGAFRKEAIEKAGGFTTDTLAEDCDLTIRILRNGYRVVNCVEAIAVTEAPETLKEFMKQRFRWSYGVMQSFWKNKDACFNPKYKGLGMISLPNILIFQIILPIFAPLADLVLIISLIWNRNNTGSLDKILIYYLVFMLVDMMVSIIAFLFEKEKLSKLLWLIPQRFVYRQLMYVILYRALREAIKGESKGWGVLKRTGNVRVLNEIKQ